MEERQRGRKEKWKRRSEGRERKKGGRKDGRIPGGYRKGKKLKLRHSYKTLQIADKAKRHHLNHSEIIVPFR